MLPLRTSYDSFLHLQLERGGHTLMGRREIHQVLATNAIARARSGIDKLAGACM